MRTDLIPVLVLGLVSLVASILLSPITMIVLGVIVFVIGFCLAHPVLQYIGLVMTIVAVAFLILSVLGIIALILGSADAAAEAAI